MLQTFDMKKLTVPPSGGVRGERGMAAQTLMPPESHQQN